MGSSTSEDIYFSWDIEGQKTLMQSCMFSASSTSYTCASTTSFSVGDPWYGYATPETSVPKKPPERDEAMLDALEGYLESIR